MMILTMSVFARAVVLDVRHRQAYLRYVLFSCSSYVDENEGANLAVHVVQRNAR